MGGGSARFVKRGTWLDAFDRFRASTHRCGQRCLRRRTRDCRPSNAICLQPAETVLAAVGEAAEIVGCRLATRRIEGGGSEASRGPGPASAVWFEGNREHGLRQEDGTSLRISTSMRHLLLPEQVRPWLSCFSADWVGLLLSFWPLSPTGPAAGALRCRAWLSSPG